MANRPKRGRTTRGRGSGRGEGSSTNPPHNPIFINSEHEAHFESEFKNRKVLYAKLVDFTFLENESLRVGNLFEAIGLKPFLALEKPMYPTLVKHFYANLTYDGLERTLDSLVGGKEFGLSRTALRHFFNLPEGDVLAIPSNQFVHNVPNFVADTFILELTGGQPPLNGMATPSYSQLNLECRLIHQIIVYCILPRTGSKTYITHFDVFLLWCVLSGTKFDLAHLMMNHFQHVWAKKKGALGYGMALTYIFERFDVTFVNEKDVHLPTSYDKINERHLRLMGFERHFQTKLWVTVSDKDLVIEEENEEGENQVDNVGGENEDDNDGDEDMPQAPPNNQGIPFENYFRDFATNMNNHFQQVNQRFDDRFNAFRTHIDENLNAYQAHIDERFNSQQAYFDARFTSQQAHFDQRFDSQQSSIDSMRDYFDQMRFQDGSGPSNKP